MLEGALTFLVILTSLRIHLGKHCKVGSLGNVTMSYIVLHLDVSIIEYFQLNLLLVLSNNKLQWLFHGCHLVEIGLVTAFYCLNYKNVFFILIFLQVQIQNVEEYNRLYSSVFRLGLACISVRVATVNTPFHS